MTTCRNDQVNEAAHVSFREASTQKKQRWKTIGMSDVFIIKKNFTFRECAIQNQNRPQSLHHESACLLCNCFVKGTRSLRTGTLCEIMAIDTRTGIHTQQHSRRPVWKKLQQQNHMSNAVCPARNFLENNNAIHWMTTATR